MPELDERVLQAIGVSLSGYEVPIPLYSRRQMVPYTENGLSLHRAQPVPLSQQYLASIVFQIVDIARFQRWVYEMTKRIVYGY